MSGVRVAVSGISGFIGSHITSDLLRKGYTVHGTVRGNIPEKIAHLPTNTPGILQVFEADLLTPDSFDEATEDCKYAIHVASPFFMEAKDPQKELLDPAVKGTLNFLASCLKNNVEKVVVTSSDAAIADGGVHGKIFDESDWNTHSSLKFLPYYFSKAEAERQAWKFAEENNMKIVVINPTWVIGPAMTKTLGESASLFVEIAEAKLPAILDLSYSVVDVRDVSEAHIRAMESDTASGRYICCPPESVIHSRDLTDLCLKEGFRPSTRDLTNPVVSTLVGFLTRLAPFRSREQLLSRHIANPMIPTSAKIVRDLDMKFIPAEETAIETIRDLLKWGHLMKPE